MCNASCDLDAKIAEWLKWDKNENTLSALRDLVSQKKTDELSRILLKRISFGTAGLRGRMSVGYACMNDLVIIQTGQGLLKYLEKSDGELLKQNGIVIGYDGRHNSKRWAELTASIFLHAGHPVKLFSEVVPTPFIPFSVRKYKCASGIMITASHNPKEDNGYKAYGPNGAQIVSPVDEYVQQSILLNLEPLDSSWDTSILSSRDSQLDDPLNDIVQSYLAIIRNTILPEHKTLNKNVGLLFTYTAMHGVGYRYIKKVFEETEIKFVPVLEQKDPHPDFPTVKFPNPEEGKSSLDLSFKTANQNNSFVIIANDPDADRLAVAEKNRQTGEWKVFTGNELGTLFGWWMLFCFKKRFPNEPLNNVYMISSTVSSMILKTMSKAEGFQFIDTLTGFKWIGNKALDLEREGKTVIFCFEEAIGFMCSTEVVDKDGVSAAFQLTTMASYLYNENKTLTEKLDEIYLNYGQHVSSNSYFICHDPVIIKKIFHRIRNFRGENTYPQGILNDKYKVTSVRDLTTGFDSNQPDNRAILPVSTDTQMITFNFSNGLVCTLRTSGTEPKIKYYTELCASPDIKNKTVIQNTLEEMVEAICEEFLQPKENNLIAKTD
ncbi:phosphoglucomutase 2 [Leptinotarsa decemlineata]|uniref:phosphoglucomutase 2 n=1 Tax=Leptinotarsa decemlineata TaxID=7539 RepID=UPI003D30B52C